MIAHASCSFLAFESETLDTPQVTSSPEPGATIFDDTISNVTYTLRDSPVGQYFEGSNLYVYIHGTEDPGGDWWRSGEVGLLARRGSGVLVNCHFDSYVSPEPATCPTPSSLIFAESRPRMVPQTTG